MIQGQQARLSSQIKKQPILIVEDDIAIGHMIAVTLLQETLYHPYIALSGHEALHVVRDITPVLFILDYQLPSMTGLQLYDQLHRREGLKAVPAIMLSANLPLLELHKRHILGITKPFEIDALLQAIAQLLA